VRSASFQFSGRPSQCSGNEPVVIEVNAYAGDGKGDVADTRAGSRVAQLSADCTDRNAFSRPIDVTAIVRQQSVASGVRHVGFNIRKANNRQGPGLFELAAGKLTVVLADQAVAAPTAAKAPQVAPVAPATRTAAAPAPASKLSKKEVQSQDRRAYIEAQRLQEQRGDRQ
jgi:septal ring-binding cell division protein DamX